VKLNIIASKEKHRISFNQKFCGVAVGCLIYFVFQFAYYCESACQHFG